MPAQISIEEKNSIEFRDLAVGEIFFAEGCEDTYIKVNKDCKCNTWDLTDGNYTTMMFDTVVKVITKVSISGSMVISDLTTYENWRDNGTNNL